MVRVAHSLPLVDNLWHTVHDSGSCGDPAVNFLFRYCHGKGSDLFDRPHRLMNDWGHGLTVSGLQVNRGEWLPTLTCRKGSFAKQLNHRVLQAASAEFFNTLSAENEIFAFFYDPLCKAFQENTSPEYGTQAHMQRIFLRTKSVMLKETVGESVKAARWQGLELRGLHFFTTPGLKDGTLMILIFIGFRRKWWRSWMDTPVFKHGGEGDIHFHDEEPEGGTTSSMALWSRGTRRRRACTRRWAMETRRTDPRAKGRPG